MLKNELFQNADTIIRILDIKENTVLILDCIRRTMPKWCSVSDLTGYAPCTDNVLYERTNTHPVPMDELDAESRKLAYERYTMIAGAIPCIGNEKERCKAIDRLAEYAGKSKQTIRSLLCLYLAFGDISVLAPKKCSHERPLTEDEKNIRWALNKFFYSKNKNSLQTAYTLMLQAKYRRAVTFGEITTERDFNAARELKQIKRKSNGQPVYIAMDSNIHRPDGYYKKNNRLIAIEYERTPKSKAKILWDNVYANRKRFHAQVWIYGKETVHKMLTELKQELGSEIIIISIETVREEIKRYVDALPTVISSKSGVPRISAVGQLVKTTPLNRLPIIGGHSAVPVLETRPGNGPDLDVRRPTSDPNPAQPIKRPEHGPVPGRNTSTMNPGPNMARTETNKKPQQGSTLTKKVILERRGS